MIRTRFVQLALGSLFAVAGLVLFAAGASAQDETTTTQLEIGGGGETTTTQLEVGGGETTTTQLDAGAEAPPNRVEAGGGGTASSATTPLALIALAGGLIVVTTAAARRVRTEQS